MHRIHLVPLFVLFAFAALLPASAFALNETYVGVLQPSGNNPPIPIVVELAEVAGILKGSVKTWFPLEGSATIESATNVYGRCTVEALIAKGVTLRLDGNCERTSFNGTYLLTEPGKRTATRGDFRLERRAPEEIKTSRFRKHPSVSSCLKTNSQCLAACPRGDPSVEFLCSNHCRTKLKTCRENAKPLAPELH